MFDSCRGLTCLVYRILFQLGPLKACRTSGEKARKDQSRRQHCQYDCNRVDAGRKPTTHKHRTAQKFAQKGAALLLQPVRSLERKFEALRNVNTLYLPTDPQRISL